MNDFFYILYILLIFEFYRIDWYREINFSKKIRDEYQKNEKVKLSAPVVITYL